MQNNRVLKLFTALLAVICLYQLSFTWVARNVEANAKAYAGDDYQKEIYYLDSISRENVLDVGFAQFTYKQVRDYELNLGLDLKGGINVILEISQKDILNSLSGFSTNAVYNDALKQANEIQKNSQDDYLTIFFEAFDRINLEKKANAKLSDFDVFGSGILRNKITAQATDDEVKKLIRAEANSAITTAYDVLRSRIDKFGVAQPNIQRLENSGRILVELPGVKDTERVTKLLQSTAKLEFWETFTYEQIASFFEAVNQREKEKLASQKAEEKPAKATQATKDTASAAKGNIDDLLESADQQDDIVQDANTELANEPLFSLLSEGNISFDQPIAGVVSEGNRDRVMQLINANRDLLPANIRFVKFLWTSKPVGQTNLYQLIAIKSNRRGKAPLDGGAVVSATRDFDPLSKAPVVSMSMDLAGAKAWAKLTKKNIGSAVAIVLDNSVYSFPVVNQEITGGNSQISGGFTLEEADDLANVLNAGKLPAPAHIIQAEIVGPSLGTASIHAGQTSFMIAFIVILIWLLFYYSQGGIYSVVALIANVLFLFGTLASFGAVLTLPGIAGIVLTIGMAVDANVLIYERIKEELFKGKSIKQAVKDGYNNAYSSILDANITTLLTAIVLFSFGTGPVKGFATTLLIGIFTSLFSAIFITRLFISAKLKKNANISFYTSLNKSWFQNMNFNFLKKRKIGYIISTAIILLGIISLFSRGLNKGVEFVGGRSYVINYTEGINTTEMSSELSDKFVENGVEASTEVKVFGKSSQVKITTSYKVNEVDNAVDIEIQEKIYNTTKKHLPLSFSFKQFEEGQDGLGIQQAIKVGPSIADDITRGAFVSVLVSLIIVFLYIFVRFKRWQYSLGAVVAVFHDAMIILSAFSLLYSFLPFSLEIDQSFIAALLTVIGYSLNDTVVVFDRVREQFAKFGVGESIEKTINTSINSTFSRTINTSLTTLFVVLVMFIFGSEAIRGFLFALLIGIIVGTYSSIYIASSIVVDTSRRSKK